MTEHSKKHTSANTNHTSANPKSVRKDNILSMLSFSGVTPARKGRQHSDRDKIDTIAYLPSLP